MEHRPASQGDTQHEAGFHQDGSEDGMSVAVVAVLVVLLIARVAGAVVIRMRIFMMVMIMGMEARHRDILTRVPMQAGGRCPGELERNDEHDDQDDEATHGEHSTELLMRTKGSFIPSDYPRRSAIFIGCA